MHYYSIRRVIGWVSHSEYCYDAVFQCKRPSSPKVLFSMWADSPMRACASAETAISTPTWPTLRRLGRPATETPRTGENARQANLWPRRRIQGCHTRTPPARRWNRLVQRSSNGGSMFRGIGPFVPGFPACACDGEGLWSGKELSVPPQKGWGRASQASPLAHKHSCAGLCRQDLSWAGFSAVPDTYAVPLVTRRSCGLQF